MTLIAAFFVPNGAITIVGDLLITTEGATENRPIDLPAQFSGQAVGDTTRVTGLKQKVVKISDRLCIAWAGNLLHAKSVLSWMKANVVDLETSNEVLDAFYSEFSDPKTLSELSLIIAAVTDGGNGDKQLTLSTHNCEVKETEGGERIHYAGTGAYHFLESMSFEELHRSAPGNVKIDLIVSSFSRVALSFLSETRGWANYEFSYGGAFEILELNPTGWRKISYALYSWMLDGETIEPVNPITRVSYEDGSATLIDQFLPNGREIISRRFIVDSPLESYSPISQASEYTERTLDLRTDVSIHYLFESGKLAKSHPFNLELNTPPPVEFDETENANTSIWVDFSRIRAFYDQR